MSNHVEMNQSRRLECFSRHQPEVLLHGIGVMICPCGCGEEDFLIPRMGPLMELSRANPDCKEFQWLAEDAKWVPIRV